MYNYIKKFDNYSWELAPNGFPYEDNTQIYEGDEIAFVLRFINLDSDKTPYNLQNFSSFQASFKPFAESSESYIAKDSNFILGQSNKAIQYDLDQGNPANTTMDELLFVDSDYSILSEFNWNELIFDIQGVLSNSIYTFLRLNINITNEVTN